MKSLTTSIILLVCLQLSNPPLSIEAAPSHVSPSGNIFIITLDGVRWQEIFAGADSSLINNEKFTPDTATMKMLYWSPDAEGRRKKLLPFLWNVIGKKGQLLGNRYYDNKVNSANIYSISYPGYNEIFTGNTDLTVSSNNKKANPNMNVLEYLNNLEEYKGKVAAFTSWDVFPFILNKERSHLILNSGYESMDDTTGSLQGLVNKAQDEAVNDKGPTRNDLLTFISAKEYVRTHLPKIVFLGLGETDETAHAARYDLYLEKATQADRMIAELWHYVQTTPFYKDNTTFIITTDHGRGKKPGTWSGHGMFVKGSSQTWLAVIGPTVYPAGELKQKGQLYQEQLAETIAEFLGEHFESNEPVARAISLKH